VDRRLLLLRLFSALTQLVATVIKNIQVLFDFVTVFFTGISGGLETTVVLNGYASNMNSVVDIQWRSYSIVRLLSAKRM